MMNDAPAPSAQAFTFIPYEEYEELKALKERHNTPAHPIAHTAKEDKDHNLPKLWLPPEKKLKSDNKTDISSSADDQGEYMEGGGIKDLSNLSRQERQTNSQLNTTSLPKSGDIQTLAQLSYQDAAVDPPAIATADAQAAGAVILNEPMGSTHGEKPLPAAPPPEPPIGDVIQSSKKIRADKYEWYWLG